VVKKSTGRKPSAKEDLGNHDEAMGARCAGGDQYGSSKAGRARAWIHVMKGAPAMLWAKDGSFFSFYNNL